MNRHDSTAGIDLDMPVDTAHARLTAETNAELIEPLYELLYRTQTSEEQLRADVISLAHAHGSEVYSELIHLLSHLRFPPTDAALHWRNIVEHRDWMTARLGVEVDLRVALVDYFLRVNPQFHNPKVVELKFFEQTQASAYRDELTQLPNYRMFRDYLAREVARSRRYDQPLSLIMLDVDDFKNYNDRNGHECGNRVLEKVARVLEETLRKIDVAARYGGEEFAVILPSTARSGASLVAERTRVAIERFDFEHGSSQPGGNVTVSMGVATHPTDARDPDELVRRADQSLYAAKSRGKNLVHVYGENRRSYRRIAASLDGKLCTLSANEHRLTTINISEGGILFLAGCELRLGALIKVQLPLPGSPHEILTTGRVVRVAEKEGGRFEAAIKTTDLNSRDRRLLALYLKRAAADQAGTEG